MPIVERAHQPRRWQGFRATREQFADMISEVVRVVSNEAGPAVEAEIEISAYERPLKVPEEFLENVEAREWIELGEITAEVRSGGARNLRVNLSVESTMGVRLTLRGADRRSRNAIEPDVVAAVERLVSGVSPDSAGARYVWLWRLLGGLTALPCVVAAIIEFSAPTGPYGLNDTPMFYGLGWAFGGLLLACAFWIIGSETRDSIRRALPAAEFLPDEGTTRWSKWQGDWQHRAKLVGAGLGVAASLSAIIALVVQVAA